MLTWNSKKITLYKKCQELASARDEFLINIPKRIYPFFFSKFQQKEADKKTTNGAL